VEIPSGGLGNLKIKAGRAYKHFKELDSLVVKYSQSCPYTISRRDDLLNQRHIIRCEFDPIDAGINLSLADARAVPLELTREEIAKIYNYVSCDVAP
jgi:hypothetical protein